MSIRSALRGVLIAALAPVGIAACGSSGETSATTSAAATSAAPKPAQSTTQAAQPAAAAKGPATVKVSQSRLGPILVEASGRTLYLFTQDKPRRAVCTSDYLNCTKIWLPLTTTGRPHGEAGVKTRLLGSLHRTKPTGSQATYNGHLLYVFVDDKQPGDLTGQGMFDYWYVVSPSGHPIKKK